VAAVVEKFAPDVRENRGRAGSEKIRICLQ
jgi:hypothetical protein